MWINKTSAGWSKSTVTVRGSRATVVGGVRGFVFQDFFLPSRFAQQSGGKKREEL